MQYVKLLKTRPLLAVIKRHKASLVMAVQLLLSVLSVYYMWRVLSVVDANSLMQLWPQQATAYWYLLAVLLLLLPNWLLEAYKWQRLVMSFSKIGLWQSLMQVWVALAWAFFTPGRSGELLSRAMQQPSNKRHATALAVRNSLAQNIATLTLGLLGLCYFYLLQLSFLPTEFEYLLPTAGFVLLLLLFVALGYMATRKHGESSAITNLALVGISFLRYTIFGSQFLLAFCFFAVADINLGLVAAVAVYYLLNTLVPVLAALEFSLKASVAALVFPVVGVSALGAVSAALLVWLVNLLIPVLVGNLLVGCRYLCARQ